MDKSDVRSNLERTVEELERLQALTTIEWTKKEKKDLEKAFTLIDNILFGVQITNQQEKVEALWQARYSLQEVVTGFGIKGMLEKLGVEER